MDKQWFKDAKFGMMIHWGLYSVLAGEYKGQKCEGIGEWIMERLRIPIFEYEKIASAFNPIYFDADEWVRIAQDAGMKYMVFTAKHHEGFAMFDSKADDYNIVKKTPFKRDVVKELSDACRKRGMKFGLYYSQELDWHEEHGGGYSIPKDSWEGKSWSNIWDFPDREKKDFSICFEKKIKPQVKELLTNYGDISLIWFDCPADISVSQSMELYDFVKKYQPDCLVNSRIGNGVGDYGSAGDNNLEDNNERGILYETPATLNDTWGYKASDQNWKSPEEIAKNLKMLNGKGINYLLNVGPDYLGRIPAESIRILKEVGKII